VPYSPTSSTPSRPSSSSPSPARSSRRSLPALPDPWRTYTPAPTPLLSSVAAGAGVAGTPQRVEDRSDRRKPVATDPAAAPAPAEGRPPGLVLCAISGRRLSDGTGVEPDDLADTAVPDSVAGLWTPAFPSPELVDAAAAMLPAVHEEPGTLTEGPRWELTVGPGVFAVACRDWARRERTEERARAAHVKDIDAAVAVHIATGEWPERPTPRTAITSWSRKSRVSLTPSTGHLV
jgi:hypothetical protein